MNVEELNIGSSEQKSLPKEEPKIDRTVFERIISNDSTLIKLDLSYQNLSSKDLEQLVEALGTNPHLRSLDISGNDLDIESAKLLAKIPQLETLIAVHCNIDDTSLIILTQNTNFISLILTDNNITGEAIKAFIEYKTLNHLDLSMNQINDDGAIILAQQRTLVSLVVSYNKIMIKGATALAQNTRLKRLDLGYNSIQAEGVAAFANNTSLTYLGLANTAGGTLGFVTLAKNQVLTTLDASYNQLGNDAAAALASSSQLTHLTLSYNQIGFEGAYALGSNTKLLVLDLSYNQICDGGAIALSRHSQLKQLDLTANRIGFEGSHALARNINITILILSYNQIGDAGAITLARNTTLTELLLSYNNIGDNGALALADNSTLKKLNLNYNNIGGKGKKALDENKAISSILLSEEQPPEFTAENLDTIFLLSESFICICNLKFIIQFFNPTFARLLGYNTDELLTKNYLDFFHPDDRQKAQKYFHDDNSISPVLSSETRFRCKNGSYRLIHWTSQVMHHRRYTIGVDITEKKEFERNFIKAQEENIWLRLQEAQAFSKQQTEFIAHLSHEVRNPLTGIYGEVDMLKEHIIALQNIINNTQQLDLPIIKKALIEKTEEMKESINQVFNCAEYQKKILEENLDSAKILEQKLILKNVIFDLSLAFNNVMQMLQSKAKIKGLGMYYQGPEVCLVKGDPIRVEQILVNLISNAIKFTHEGRIDIDLAVTANTPNFTQIEFTVRDTGTGINSIEMEKLFKRFNREAKNEHEESSGLGLYIIKQLIKVMGGNISVKSENKKGSMFTVSIPFQSLTEEETQSMQIAKKASEPITIVQQPFLFKKLNILIVDDIQLNRKIIGRYFAENPDYKCEYAINGEEAVAAFDKQKFDIILMDIVMPVMDGIIATQTIRKHEKIKGLPRTPIIAITANALERDKTEALASGFDDFILKPYKKADILQKITELVQNENPEPHFIVRTAPTSPARNQQLREILNTITPGKKWQAHDKISSVCLELQSEEEALMVMSHFKVHDYSGIERTNKVGKALSIPVLVLKEIALEKLKTIPPIAELIKEPLKESSSQGFFRSN